MWIGIDPYNLLLLTARHNRQYYDPSTLYSSLVSATSGPSTAAAQLPKSSFIHLEFSKSQKLS